MENKLFRHTTTNFIILVFFVVLISDLNAGQSQDGKLDAWIRDIQRPGFSLLFEKREKMILFAVFKAEGNCIAVCYENLDPASQRSHTTTHIVSAKGDGLLDNSRPSMSLTRDWKTPTETGFRGGTVRDGFLYPLSKYHGLGTVTFVFYDDLDETKNVTILATILL